MTLDEAKLQMARLMVAEGRACGDGSAGGPGRPFAADRDHRREYEAARHTLRQYGERLAATPELYGHLVPWMVDVRGRAGGPLEESDVRLLEEDPRGFTAKKGGGLAAAVERTVMRVLGLRATDRGAGGGVWHLGFPCSERESVKLCGVVHFHFGDRLAAGRLEMFKRFWGWKLRGLPNYPAAERFLAERGET